MRMTIEATDMVPSLSEVPGALDVEVLVSSGCSSMIGWVTVVEGDGACRICDEAEFGWIDCAFRDVLTETLGNESAAVLAEVARAATAYAATRRAA